MVLEGVSRKSTSLLTPAPRLLARRAAGFLCILVVALTSPELGAAGQAELTKELQRLEGVYGGHMGVMAKNLKTGEVVAFRSSERFPTASAIKLPIMAAFFHRVDQGAIDPTKKVTLTKDDRKPGSVLEHLSDGSTIELLDAVRLMIVYSDNTATNLVLDRLADSHDERLRLVNDFLAQQGLKNTRLLNRLYTWETKKQTPEAIRYGIGVSTPEDMVALLEALYLGTLADSVSCRSMLEILQAQSDHDMIPRYLPAGRCKYLATAHKTGSIQEVKVDVGLVLSDTLTMAIAIFVDKHPDHTDDPENRAVLLAAHASRAVWNYFAGMAGYEDRTLPSHSVDWNVFPGGKWGIYRTAAAPFPHGKRRDGFARKDGTFYPYSPHYCDSSVVVVVPNGFQETDRGSNVIVHFHGHLSDNLEVLERYKMPQALVGQRVNALLVLPQGPYWAADSFGGRMEDEGGLQRLVGDVLTTLKGEGVLKTTKLHKLIISAHSGGGRAAGFSLAQGGLQAHVTDVFLFDALYEQEESFRTWVTGAKGILHGCYTDHLAENYARLVQSVSQDARLRVEFSQSPVDHWQLVTDFFPIWLSHLDSSWRMQNK